jgi:ParB family transcriptional regulator, chromosome partitioning protein
VEIELHELELRYAALRIDAAARRAEFVAKIALHGQQGAVLVIREDDRFVLIDGYARVAALRELGHDLVEAALLEVPEAEALVLAHRLEAKRPRSALEEGWLVLELVERHGLDQSTIATRLRRTKGWVSRRLGLVRALPEAVQAKIRSGIVPAHAAAKYLVPLARANRAHCEQLGAALGGDRVTDREIGRLYVLWKTADAEGRLAIVTRPRLALKADAAVQPEPPVPAGDPAGPLLGDLDGIAGIARRARRRLDEGVLHELDVRRRGLVSRSGTVAKRAVQTLVELLDQEEPACSTATPAPPS